MPRLIFLLIFYLIKFYYKVGQKYHIELTFRSESSMYLIYLL